MTQKPYIIGIFMLVNLFSCSQETDIVINVKVRDIKCNQLLKYNEQMEYMSFKMITENDNEIIIGPTSSYYDKYVSDSHFMVPEIACVDESTPNEYNEYMHLEYYIVNNSNEDLSINSLNIEISSSEPDYFPYIYIATEEEYGSQLTLSNESWGNWGGATMKYKILKRGEDFMGEYDEEKIIPYFNDFYRVDFLPELTKMGYNVDNVRNLGKENGWYAAKGENNYVLAYITDDNFDKYEKALYPFEIKKNSFFDSYAGFARIYGELSFDNSDFKVSFFAHLSLTTEAGFGAYMEDDDRFDVQLAYNQNNYIKRLPYITTIKPGGSERVTLTFMCPKSSNHKFTLNAQNDNGLVIKSKEIKLHFLNPKHSSKIIWQKQKAYAYL